MCRINLKKKIVIHIIKYNKIAADIAYLDAEPFIVSQETTSNFLLYLLSDLFAFRIIACIKLPIKGIIIKLI